jgi:phosphonate transport system substrate-binding protein
LLTGQISALAQNPQTEFQFGIMSIEALDKQKQVWEPFAAAMSKATGQKVSIFYTADYAAVVEAMRDNKIQIGWLGNVSAIDAVDHANGEVVAQMVASDGSTGHFSHMLVHNDSPYQTLDDVLKCDKSIDFAIGVPRSTTGFLVPMTYIFAAENVDPGRCFKSVRNGTHEANALAVAAKEAHAGICFSEGLHRLAQNHPDAHKQLRIIWTSPEIPLDPIVWRKDLDPLVKTKFYNFLLNYGRSGKPAEIAAARQILKNLAWAPLHPSSNSQLIQIRLLQATTKLVALRSARNLPPDQKARQVAETIAELGRLSEQRAKLSSDPVQKQVDAFIAAEKSGDAGELKRIIEAFAANYSRTN